jgi:hypothetical protein
MVNKIAAASQCRGEANRQRDAVGQIQVPDYFVPGLLDHVIIPRPSRRVTLPRSAGESNPSLLDLRWSDARIGGER